LQKSKGIAAAERARPGRSNVRQLRAVNREWVAPASVIVAAGAAAHRIY
jgi:hypothetical protein